MKPEQTMLYVPIDFVGSDARARIFAETLCDSLIMAQSEIEKQKFPIHLGFKTTIISKDKDGWGVSEEGKEDFDAGIERLREAGIDYWVETWASGPTRSMYGVFFDQGAIARGFRTIATGDLDVIPPHKNLERFLQLEDKVKSTNSVLGVGSRNKPIVLAYNPQNKNLRRIMEGVYNMAVRKAAKYFNHAIHDANPSEAPDDSAYNFHGDFITGVYLFNPDSRQSERLASDCVTEARKEGFIGFEDEYFMAIHAAELGNLAAAYFNTEENLFDQLDAAEEREKIMERQIKAPLKKLEGTSVFRFIGDFNCLDGFYNKEEISTIINHIGFQLY